MFRTYHFTALFLTLFLGVLMYASPDRPERKKPGPPVLPKKMLPDLSFRSNWGDITQKGKVITLQGHPDWDGDGEIRADGKVVIAWTCRPSGRHGIGVYTITPAGELAGHWGWFGTVVIEANGQLTGQLIHDAITRTPR